ncbi:hypothetical protein SERLADRAFT_473766 [Serpula lacrymans var. lacrymans S7.9]|uniref:Cytochrome P450 n=1 Tax=Serpula lacrymans var. lacrymans (strain S7.9) TaxID=578457 RepID=F8P3D0_SERL9|nr:uncharacterized protein SERLADRAFT_473766 [Serpula lacrymans var. lacrymans S7.9]EGO22661.1 hypothetical protein SERLADRAFT_473766 [Serpula lacrymans var. lacrymans S7.9]
MLGLGTIWAGMSLSSVLSSPPSLSSPPPTHNVSNQYINHIRNTNQMHSSTRILGECVGFKHTDDWRRIRSHTDRHFTASIAIESIPVLMKDVKEWFDGLEGKGFIKPISEKGKKMEVMASDLFWDIPFKMISKVIFGEMLDDNLFKELWSYNGLHERLMMTSFFGKLEQWALSSYLPTAANRDMAAFQRGWGDLLKRVSNEAYEKGIFMPVGEMYKKVLDGEMTFPEFTHTIDETLFTNIDATTVSIMWAVTLVAQHEEVQERLLSEIAQIWEPEGDEEDQLNLYLKRTDTLLHHCYMESGRLRPILFYSMSEQTADSKVIRGHVIPAETSILINGHALNRVSPIWSPDGDVFRPDRFASLSPAVYRYSFWRFGMGPRKCLGMHFADKVVKCCLFESVRRYKISVRGEVDVRRDRFVQMPLATLVFERH